MHWQRRGEAAELQVRRGELAVLPGSEAPLAHPTPSDSTIGTYRTVTVLKCTWEPNWGAPLGGSERQRHSEAAAQRTVPREDGSRTQSVNVNPTSEALATAQVELEAHK